MSVFAPTLTVSESPNRVVVVFKGALGRVVWLPINALLCVLAAVSMPKMWLVSVIIFALPSALVLYGALGRETLDLTRDRLTFTRSLLGLSWRRQFSIGGLRKFEF